MRADRILRLACAVGVLWGLQASTSFGQTTAVPGTWYDQDYYHLPVEPTSGASWTHNFTPGESHEPGDPWSEAYDSYYTHQLDDYSCWMASAANILQYLGLANSYNSWAYDVGVNVSGTWKTFDDAGLQEEALNFAGYTPVNIHSLPLVGWWLQSPVDWIETRLTQALPVGLGMMISGRPVGHALTIYAIDRTFSRMQVADSAQDPGAYSWYDYSWDGTSLTLDYNSAYGSDTWAITYLSVTRPNEWHGSGGGGASSDWDMPGNWSVGSCPTDKDPVEIAFSSAGHLDVSGSASACRLRAYGAGGTLHVQSGANLHVYRSEHIGDSGTATVVQDGGVHTVDRDLELGRLAGGSGTYQLSGGQLSALNLYVGRAGTGAFSWSGGTLSVSRVEVGPQGTFTLAGPTWNLVGTLTIAGGAVNSTSSSLWIDADGIVQMSSGSLNAGYMRIGNSASGRFEQTGGEHRGHASLAARLELGSMSGSQGAYSLTAGSLTAAYEWVGVNGAGTFTQTGGSNTVTEYLQLAHLAAGSTGSYTLSGGTLSCKVIEIGETGTGEFAQSGGIHTVSAALYLGFNGTGTYLLSGTDSCRLSAPDEYIGGYYANNTGNGTFTQTGGRNTVGNALHIGRGTASSAAYNLQGGTLVAGSVCVGNQGESPPESRQDLLVASSVCAGNQGTACLNWTGGSLSAASIQVGPQGTMIVGQNWTYDGSLSVAGGSVDISGHTLTIGNGGSLRGYGTVTGAVANDYQVYSEGGTLTINGALTNRASAWAPAGSTLTVTGGITNEVTATLFGRGTIQADVTNAGTLRPDYGSNSALTIQGSVTSSGWITTNGAGDALTITGYLTTIPGANVWPAKGSSLVMGYLLHNPGSQCTFDGANVTVNNWLETNGNVTLSDGQLSAGSERVYSSAAFTQTGGSNVVTGGLGLSGLGDGVATYELRSGLLSAESAAVGWQGQGRFSQTGGDFTTTTDLYIGGVPGSDGSYAQSSGTNTVTGLLMLGYCADSTGTYNLQDGFLSARQSHVGFSGSGSFTQSGGTNSPNDVLCVGLNAGSTGVYELGGGQLTALFEVIGQWGSGRLTQTGGANHVYGLLIGSWPGSSGLYELKGTGQLTVDFVSVVGDCNAGTFSQTGGTGSMNCLYIGYHPGADGVYGLGGGSLSVTGLEVVGYEDAATGTFTQSGGTHTANDLYVGYQTGSDGTYNLHGGTLTAQSVYVGSQGTGRLNWTGGGLSAANIEVGLQGTLDVGLTAEHAGALRASGGTLDVGAGCVFTVSGAFGIDSGATLTKDGDGMLRVLGLQDNGADSVFNIIDGTVFLNTDAGTDVAANLSISVTDATLYFGHDQHLDTLEIGDGGKVALAGARVVVLNHLVMGGLDLGATVMTPEPTTLGLLALGGLAMLLQRRR